MRLNHLETYFPVPAWLVLKTILDPDEDDALWWGRLKQIYECLIAKYDNIKYNQVIMQ